MVLAVVVIEQLGGDAAPDAHAAAHPEDVLVLSFGQATPLARSAAPGELIDPGWDASTAAPTSPELGDDAAVHIVRAGDTLSSIALQHLGDPSQADELARLNDLADPDALYEGQRIRLR